MQGWYELQQKFLSLLPVGTVQESAHYLGYKELEGQGVQLDFEDLPPVSARILIGADGYFSAVRNQCLGDGPPTFAVRVSWGFLRVRALIPAPKVAVIYNQCLGDCPPRTVSGFALCSFIGLHRPPRPDMINKKYCLRCHCIKRGFNVGIVKNDPINCVC